MGKRVSDRRIGDGIHPKNRKRVRRLRREQAAAAAAAAPAETRTQRTTTRPSTTTPESDGEIREGENYYIEDRRGNVVAEAQVETVSHTIGEAYIRIVAPKGGSNYYRVDERDRVPLNRLKPIANDQPSNDAEIRVGDIRDYISGGSPLVELEVTEIHDNGSLDVTVTRSLRSSYDVGKKFTRERIAGDLGPRKNTDRAPQKPEEGQAYIVNDDDVRFSAKVLWANRDGTIALEVVNTMGESYYKDDQIFAGKGLLAVPVEALERDASGAFTMPPGSAAVPMRFVP